MVKFSNSRGHFPQTYFKTLEKPSRLTEKELAEAASKWAAEKLEKADESNLPEISEYEVRHNFFCICLDFKL